MDFSPLAVLSERHRSRLTAALLNDGFFAPIAGVHIDRTSGQLAVQYLHSQVSGPNGPIRYLPLFSHQSYWRSLDITCDGLVQPPLAHLREQLSDQPVVVDLGSEHAFTATLDALLELKARAEVLNSDRP